MVESFPHLGVIVVRTIYIFFYIYIFAFDSPFLLFCSSFFYVISDNMRPRREPAAVLEKIIIKKKLFGATVVADGV